MMVQQRPGQGNRRASDWRLGATRGRDPIRNRALRQIISFRRS